MADDLALLSHEELFRMRAGNPDASYQRQIAPYEHMAFAREMATDTPVQALGLLAAIPGYQVAKATGLMKSRTGANQPWEQILAGYKGLAQGWLGAAQRGFGALLKPAQPAASPLMLGPGAVPGKIPGAQVGSTL